MDFGDIGDNTSHEHGDECGACAFCRVEERDLNFKDVVLDLMALQVVASSEQTVLQGACGLNLFTEQLFDELMLAGVFAVRAEHGADDDDLRGGPDGTVPEVVSGQVDRAASAISAAYIAASRSISDGILEEDGGHIGTWFTVMLRNLLGSVGDEDAEGALTALLMGVFSRFVPLPHTARQMDMMETQSESIASLIVERARKIPERVTETGN